MSIIVRRDFVDGAIALPVSWIQYRQDTELWVAIDPQWRQYHCWLEVDGSDVGSPGEGVFRVHGASAPAKDRLKAFAESSPSAWTRSELIADTGAVAMAIKAVWKHRRDAADPDTRPDIAARRTVFGYDHMAEDDAAPATIGDMT